MKKIYSTLLFSLVIVSSFAITKCKILQNAYMYRDHAFTVTSCNIGSAGNQVYSAPYIVLGTNKSVPYRYAGYSTSYPISKFQTNLNNCRKAGAKYPTGVGFNRDKYILNSNTAGTDCSGFTCQAAETPSYASTAWMHTLSGQYGSVNQLEGGDIMNKAGSHVRMVIKRNSNGTLHIIESAVGGWRVYETGSMSMSKFSGYVPRYYFNATSGGCAPPTPPDQTPPSTNFTVAQDWKKSSFNVTFNDADNHTTASGLTHRFYRVVEHIGNNIYQTNSTRGYLNENMDKSMPWHSKTTGTWSYSGGKLIQSDESAGNADMFFPISIKGDNVVYQWKAAVKGSGSNRRMGFKFLCSKNTGLGENGYHLYIGGPKNEVVLFRIQNNTYNLYGKLATSPVKINDKQEHLYRLFHNRKDGWIMLQIDGKIAYFDGFDKDTYLDFNQFWTNTYVSLSSQGSRLEVDHLVVWRERTGSTVNVKVGTGNTNDIRVQNGCSPSYQAGWMASLVKDAAHNYGAKATTFNVDFTPPSKGTVDVTSSSLTSVNFSWKDFVDDHSCIDNSTYRYSIGTACGGTQIKGWTAATGTSQTASGLSLLNNTDYYVSVKVKNKAGLESTYACKKFSIPKPPVASFAANKTTICAGESITFTNSSTDADSYSWKLNGASPSTTSTNPSPTVTFNTAGTHTIELTASNTGGTNKLSKTITVKPAPNAKITTSKLEICAGDFTTIKANNGASYLWSNGATGDSISVTQGGTYKVTVTGSNGCKTISSGMKITVNPLPTPVITATGATNVCEGENVPIDITGVSNGKSYAWSDGQTSSSINVQQSGTYMVTVTDIKNCKGTSNGISINLKPAPKPTLMPDTTIINLCQGASQVITASSTSGQYNWSSGQTTANLTVSATGKYTVSTTYSNGCIRASDEIDVTVHNNPTPTIIGATSFCDGDTAVLATQNFESYNWSTGGTNKEEKVTSTQSITLEVTDKNGCKGSFTGFNIAELPSAQATFTTANAQDTLLTLPGANVSFNNTSSNATSYIWDFGDGNTSADLHPTHTYTSTGKYTLKLIAQNTSCGNDTLVLSNFIRVKDNSPVAAFSVPTSTTCNGGTVAFQNTSDNALSYEWNFVGGTPNTSTDKDPIISYAQSGNYSVQLVITGIGGKSDTILKQITVSVLNGPVADYSTINQGKVVVFTNASKNGVTYNWDFGDGATSSSQSPFHDYKTDGIYTATLIVSNGNCSDTISKQIIVGSPASINNSNVSNINVFPNPANEFVTINIEDFQNKNIELIDISGKLIQSKLANSKNTTLDLEELSSGVYFLRIQQNDTLFLKKLIVK
jgi:PKD repeat protein